MPIFAPIAMLTATYIDSTLKSPQSLTKIGQTFTWVFTAVLLLIGLALTPLYFYVKKLYPMDVSETLLIQIIVLSVFMIALSFAAIRYFQQRDLKKYWISMNASIYPCAALCANGCHACPGYSQEFCPFLPTNSHHSACW